MPVLNSTFSTRRIPRQSGSPAGPSSICSAITWQFVALTTAQREHVGFTNACFRSTVSVGTGASLVLPELRLVGDPLSPTSAPAPVLPFITTWESADYLHACSGEFTSASHIVPFGPESGG
jgi:hypothetical protein